MKCVACDNTFKLTARAPHQRYCSKACAHRAYRKAGTIKDKRTYQDRKAYLEAYCAANREHIRTEAHRRYLENYVPPQPRVFTCTTCTKTWEGHYPSDLCPEHRKERQLQCAKANQKRIYAERKVKAACVRCGKDERLGAMGFCAPCYCEIKHNKIAWAIEHPKASKDEWKRARLEGEAEGHYTPTDLLERVALFDNRCAWCGTEKWKTFDHVQSLACGGTNWPSNLVPSCTPCNSEKHDKQPALYARERLTSGRAVTAFALSLLNERTTAPRTTVPRSTELNHHDC